MKTRQPGRTTISLSFSVPPEMEPLINARAAQLRLTRSEYIRRVVEQDLLGCGLVTVSDLGQWQVTRIRRAAGES